MCAPSMGKGIEDTLHIPESASLLLASWCSQLVSRKLVCCEAGSEGSETTNSGTD